MASTPSSSLAASSCSTTVSALPASASDLKSRLESFLTLTGFFAARVSVAGDAGVLIVAGVGGGLGAAGVSGAAGVLGAAGGLSAEGVSGAAGGLGATGGLGARGALGVVATVARTIEVDATIANTTTPAAMNGRRCFGANDRSKPRSLSNLSMRGVRLLALAIATPVSGQCDRDANASRISA